MMVTYRQSKVGHLRPGGRWVLRVVAEHEDVARCQVAVHHALFGQRLHAGAHLPHYGQLVRQAEPCWPRLKLCLQQLVKRAMRRILSEEQLLVL